MWKVTNANIVKTQKVGHLQNRSARGKKKKSHWEILIKAYSVLEAGYTGI